MSSDFRLKFRSIHRPDLSLLPGGEANEKHNQQYPPVQIRVYCSLHTNEDNMDARHRQLICASKKPPKEQASRLCNDNILYAQEPKTLHACRFPAHVPTRSESLLLIPAWNAQPHARGMTLERQFQDRRLGSYQRLQSRAVRF
jgi:hypothetical protein